jgi:hypothetical protein
MIVGCRKLKEKYYGYSDTNKIFYVVHDSERSIAGSLVADVYVCRRLDLPNTQQMVLHSKRGLQRSDILFSRTIQSIGLCVQSYSLRGSADHQIKRSIQQTQIHSYRQRKR